MSDPRIGMAKLVAFMALLMAALVSIVPPVTYFIFGVRGETTTMAVEADSLSRQISQIVSRNPTLWQFESLRIDDILQFSNAGAAVERRTVLTVEGDVVSAIPDLAEPLDWPVIHETSLLYDFGVAVGRIEIERSIRPLLMHTAIVAIVSLILGIGAFVILRVWPLRLLRNALNRVSYLASHDPLTGLPNRSLFSDRLENSLSLTSRDKASHVAVLSLDLDNFKDVNDTFGHPAGDALLINVAKRIENCLREGDSVARFGGDEFAIVQTGRDFPNDAAVLAKRLVEEIAAPHIIDGQTVVVGSSVGIAVYPTDGTDPETLVRNADTALYRAKATGRGAYVFFEEEMNLRLRKRKQLESDLRQAFEAGDFRLHYQPQIDLSVGTLTGVEALLRWTHPTNGEMTPDEFIPIAEEMGLIVPLGEWVLRTACRDALAWPGLNVAVNVSPVQFKSDLAGTVERALADTGLDPKRLEIEITEGILIQDPETTVVTLNRLKALGVRIAMDDFGTGYSSINYLRRFPFDKIKVDRSFVSGLGDDQQAEKIVRSVVALGKSLGMTANAEGVETDAQAQWLLREGCDEVQGFHFGRPMSAKNISWLADGNVALETVLRPKPLPDESGVEVVTTNLRS